MGFRASIKRRPLVALIAVLACVLVGVIVWKPSPKVRAETPAQRLALLQREIEVLQKQDPSAACPSGLAAEKDLRIAMFYGYANFDDVVLDAGFANAMASALEMPCRGALVACGFVEARHDANSVTLKKDLEGRGASIDIRWTALAPGSTRKQEDQSRETKELFYRALQESDVVLYTGHSRGGSGLGFDPSTKTDIAIDLVFRSPAKAIVKAMSARPSRLKVFGAMACEADKYYSKEFRAANPDATFLLAEGNISSQQSDQINLAILNALLGGQCVDKLQSVDDPTANIRLVRAASR